MALPPGADHVEAALEQRHSHLARLGYELPAATLAAVSGLPSGTAMRMLSGLAAPHIRSPVGYLRHRLAQLRREAPAHAGASASQGAGVAATQDHNEEVAKRVKREDEPPQQAAPAGGLAAGCEQWETGWRCSGTGRVQPHGLRRGSKLMAAPAKMRRERAVGLAFGPALAASKYLRYCLGTPLVIFKVTHETATEQEETPNPASVFSPAVILEMVSRLQIWHRRWNAERLCGIAGVMQSCHSWQALSSRLTPFPWCAKGVCDSQTCTRTFARSTRRG